MSSGKMNRASLPQPKAGKTSIADYFKPRLAPTVPAPPIAQTPQSTRFSGEVAPIDAHSALSQRGGSDVLYLRLAMTKELELLESAFAPTLGRVVRIVDGLTGLGSVVRSDLVYNALERLGLELITAYSNTALADAETPAEEDRRKRKEAERRSVSAVKKREGGKQGRTGPSKKTKR